MTVGFVLSSYHPDSRSGVAHKGLLHRGGRMETTEWFKALGKDDRKRLLSLIHELRRGLPTGEDQELVVELLQVMESDHEKGSRDSLP